MTLHLPFCHFLIFLPVEIEDDVDGWPPMLADFLFNFLPTGFSLF
jgi:hypothetical protein